MNRHIPFVISLLIAARQDLRIVAALAKLSAKVQNMVPLGRGGGGEQADDDEDLQGRSPLDTTLLRTNSPAHWSV